MIYEVRDVDDLTEFAGPELLTKISADLHDGKEVRMHSYAAHDATVYENVIDARQLTDPMYSNWWTTPESGR